MGSNPIDHPGLLASPSVPQVDDERYLGLINKVRAMQSATLRMLGTLGTARHPASQPLPA